MPIKGALIMKNIIATAFLFATLVAVPRVPAAVILSVSPSPVEVAPGSSFQLNVTLSGFPDIVGFQFDVSYPSFLNLDTVTEGGFFAANGVTFSPGTAGVGTVTGISDVLISPGVPDPDTLVILGFTATGPGSGVVSLDNIVLLDSTFSTAIVDQTDPAIVTVTSSADVPEPESWVLVLIGLGLLHVCHRLSPNMLWRNRYRTDG
jgi:hypothetical protein